MSRGAEEEEDEVLVVEGVQVAKDLVQTVTRFGAG